jgi:hypothetical protein
MQRLISFIRKYDFTIFLFILFLLIYIWPLLSIAGLNNPESLFIYLFLTWSILIIILFLLNRISVKETIAEEKNRRNSSHDV